MPDADADGGSDPYARFCLLDLLSTGDYFPKKETAYTGYKKNEANPVWEGERLQLELPPEDAKPPMLRIEVWDKDVQSPDDIIASVDLPLTQGESGTYNVTLKGVGDMDDIPEFKFSYTMLVEKEAPQEVRRATLTGAGGKAGGAAKPKKK